MCVLAPPGECSSLRSQEADHDELDDLLQARIEVEDAEEHRAKVEKQKAERAEREKARRGQEG